MADEKVKVSSLVTVAPKTTDKVLITTTDDSGQVQTRNALVSDIRNLAASLEDSEDKAINVKIANEIIKKVTDLASEVDTSFETVNQNFTNVNNAISQNRDNITTANENMTAHEEDTDLHVTAEKQQKWDGYDQSIKDVKEIADNNTTQLNDLANERGYARVKRFEVETDLNALTESGVYASSKFLNGNDNEKTWNIVEVFNMSIDNQIYCIQRIMGIADGGDRTFERRCNNGIWSEWIQLCYAKLENTTFSVSEGYTATLNSIKKDSNGRCIIYGIIKKTDGGVFLTDNPIVLGTIPAGFIPMYAINAPIRSYRGNVNQSSDPTMMLLDSANGNITISNIVDNTVEVQFTIAYDAKEV